MARRGNRSKTQGVALGLWVAVVIAAGALGWGVAIDLPPGRPEWTPPPAALPGALRLRPLWLPEVEVLRASRRGPAHGPRQFTGLHMAFSQEWPQGVYEIGSSGQQKQPPSSSVRVLCAGCPAVNWALNLSPDSASDKEKLMVNAATFGVIVMAGNGRMTLLEWSP